MFGNMFNDIDVVRYTNDGDVSRVIRVPIAYGPRDRFLSRLATDPNLDREIAIQLPRLAFEMTDLQYDPARSLNKLTRNVNLGDNASRLRGQYTPVPYNINLSLYAMFRYNEDAVQVMEQILPFFRPEWTNSVRLIPEIGDFYDVPTILNGVDIQDNYDSNFEDRRAIIYTYTFTVKGYIFGPVTNKGVITRTDLNFKTDTVATANTAQRTVLVPGQTSEGLPTANAAASVSRNQISANSNYGFAFDKQDFFSGFE